MKLYGGVREKPFIGAVVDVALSQGARLTAWRPDEKADYEANAHYQQLRKTVLEHIRTTKTIESSDAAQAIANYTDALTRACAYERFAGERDLFPETDKQLRFMQQLSKLDLSSTFGEFVQVDVLRSLWETRRRHARMHGPPSGGPSRRDPREARLPPYQTTGIRAPNTST